MRKCKETEHLIKIYKPKTIDEAFDMFLRFWRLDIDYTFEEEWKTPEDAFKDIEAHTNILRNQIKELTEEKGA